MDIKNLNNFINPFSNGFINTARHFRDLSVPQRVFTVALTVITGLATVYVAGIGGFAVFKTLVDRFSVKKLEPATIPDIDIVQEVALPVLNIVPEPSEEAVAWGRELLKLMRSCDHTQDGEVSVYIQNQDRLEAHIVKGVENGFLNEKVDLRCSGTILTKICKLDKYAKFIPLLIKNGADIASQDSLGNTGLIWAIANASNEAAMIILECCGEGDYLNLLGIGNAAIHMAVGKGYKNITAQQQKLTHSNLEIVGALIANKCDVNIKNRDNNTPLHLACVRHDIAMIKALLLAGARLDIKNKNGQIPLQMLSVPYQEACNLISNTVGYFLLDADEFQANLEEAQRLFQNPTRSFTS